MSDVGLRGHAGSFARSGRRHSRAGHASGSVASRTSTAEGIDIADLDDGGDWLVEQGLGRVRIRATSRTDGVFVGIAREADVDRYMAGTAHDELREAHTGSDPYVSREGGAPAPAPGDAGIWVASAAGEGTQTVEWGARDGRWAVVVMNANAAAPVAADVSVGAKLGVLPWISGGLLLAGLLALALGAGLIGTAVRGPARRTPPPLRTARRISPSPPSRLDP